MSYSAQVLIENHKNLSNILSGKLDGISQEKLHNAQMALKDLADSIKILTGKDITKPEKPKNTLNVIEFPIAPDLPYSCITERT